MLRKRGNIWWYRFKFGGRVFEETTRTSSRRLAERILTKRRRELEEGLHGLRKRPSPVLFRVAARDWLTRGKAKRQAALKLKRKQQHAGAPSTQSKKRSR